MSTSRPDVLYVAINYYFPPIHSVATLRNYMMYQLFSKEVTATHVFSTSNYALFSQSDIATREINLHHNKTRDYRWIKAKLRPGADFHFSESQKKSLASRFVVKLLNSFPFNLWIGEGGLTYRNTIVDQASTLIEKYDRIILYSSFRPFSDHEIAYRLKKRFPHIYWIADFRDVHVDPLKKNVFWKNFQEKRGQEMLQLADCVTAVSQGTADCLPVDRPVHILPNGMHSLGKRTGPASSEFKKFTISYTGSLYGEMRDPSLVFKCVQTMIEEGLIDSTHVELRYAGKDAIQWAAHAQKYNVESIAITQDLIPLEEARAIQAGSHVNLLLTFSHPEVAGALTGKLFEYVSEQRPILVIINGVKDEEIETLIDKLKAGIVVYNRDEDVESVKSFILAEYRFWKENGRGRKCENDEHIEAYRWPTLFREFMNQSGLKKKLDDPESWK